MTRNCLALALLATLCCQLAAAMTDSEWAAAMNAAINRPREVIYSTDGDDALWFPDSKPHTKENFYAIRLNYCLNTEVSTLIYSSGYIGHVNIPGPHNDQIVSHAIDGNGLHNCIPAFNEQGTDPLRMAVEFARKHNLEIFGSLRMNDTHDGAHSAANPYPHWPQFKEEHPEVLFGTEKNRPPFCSWTAVDFAQPLVRERMLGTFQDICSGYDVDGIECDLMRHTQLFKSVGWGKHASQEELDILTGMIASLREIAQREGRRKGKPILLVVRVPDSVEYCRAVGIDLEEWLKRGLVDLLVTTSYFQLNPWKYSADLAHKYGVKFYASLDESRINEFLPGCGRRSSDLSYAARALAARRAGADGIYYFNLEGGGLRANGFGSFATLATRSKSYYASARGSGGYQAGGYVRNGEYFNNMVSLEPRSPSALGTDGKLEFEMEIGDDLSAPASKELFRRAIAQLRTNHPELKLRLTINGHDFDPASQTDDDVLEYHLTPEAIRPGDNRIRISNPVQDYNPPVQMRTILKGNQLMVYGKNQGRWRRFFLDDQHEEIQDGAYLLEDVSPNMGGAFYHPLLPSSGAVRTRFTMRVKSTNDPDGVVLRLADGRHVEVVQFLPDQIRLKFAQTSAKFNTTGQFHQYEVMMDTAKITVLADGKALLEAPVAASVTDPITELPDTAMGAGIGRINSEGMIIGSLAAAGNGAALWKDVQLDQNGVLITDFAIRIDYTTPPPKQLKALENAPVEIVAEAGVRDGKPYTSPGVAATSYNKDTLQVAPDGKGLILEHDAPNQYQSIDLFPALPVPPATQFFVVEWAAQPLRDGPDGQPCLSTGIAPPRPFGKGAWEIVLNMSTTTLFTQMGDLPLNPKQPGESHHFRCLMDLYTGEAIIWYDGKMALVGKVTGGLHREKPFLFIGDGSGRIAGQARLDYIKAGYVTGK